MEQQINNQTEKVPQDVYWMVSYLREDSQDIKNEIRELRKTTQDNYRTLDEKIDKNAKDLNSKIEQNTWEIKELRVDMHKALARQQAWIIGTIIAASGLIIALGRFL